MNLARSDRSVRVTGGILCVMLFAALAVAGAGADVNPAGGSNFDANDNGWQVTTAECRFGEGEAGGLCTATGGQVPDGGNPGGALRARTEVLANSGGLFTSQYVFRSASFTLEDQFDGVFSYDRQFVRGPFVAVGVRAEIGVYLVNDADASERLLFEDPLGEDDAQYQNRLVGVPSGALTENGSYHLELRVSTGSDSGQNQLLGSTDVLIDNVRFVTSDRGDGTANGPGVAPGGSVTLLRECTIIGTNGDDNIVGTRKTDIICALGGDDTVKTFGGPDVIDGADGNDVEKGGKKADLLLGLKGKDRLIGAKGADRLLGGKDRDVLRAGADNDNISARDGERDIVDGGPGKRNRARTDGKDKVKRVQRLMGR